jgi:hypothetical protein
MDFRLVKQKELLAISSQLENSSIMIKFLLSTNLLVVMCDCDLVSLPKPSNKFLKKLSCESYFKKFSYVFQGVKISAAPCINDVNTMCSKISGPFNDYGIVAFMSGDHLLHMAT